MPKDRKRKKRGIKYVLSTLVVWIASSCSSPISQEEAHKLLDMIKKEL